MLRRSAAILTRSSAPPVRRGLSGTEARRPMQRSFDTVEAGHREVDLVVLGDLFLPTYKNCQIYLCLSSHKTKLVH